MDDNSKFDASRIRFKGKSYETNPGIMDRVKESFQTTDDRAQLEAIRRARQTALNNGLGR